MSQFPPLEGGLNLPEMASEDGHLVGHKRELQLLGPCALDQLGEEQMVKG